MVDLNRCEKISREIISQVRTTIVMSMRFLDMAVFRLRPVPEKVKFATDGENLYYAPLWLLRRYREEANAVTHDHMHVLMHCIFRHPFVNALVDQRLWDLSCDIAAEGMICELNRSILTTALTVRRKAIVDGLRMRVKPLTAEKLYAYFRDTRHSDAIACRRAGRS